MATFLCTSLPPTLRLRHLRQPGLPILGHFWILSDFVGLPVWSLAWYHFPSAPLFISSDNNLPFSCTKSGVEFIALIIGANLLVLSSTTSLLCFGTATKKHLLAIPIAHHSTPERRAKIRDNQKSETWNKKGNMTTLEGTSTKDWLQGADAKEKWLRGLKLPILKHVSV